MAPKVLGSSFYQALLAYQTANNIQIIGEHFSWDAEGNLYFYSDTPADVQDAVQAVYDAYIPPTALSEAQAARSSAMQSSCASAIASGFTSSALGTAYTYPSDDATQRNIAFAVAGGGDLWCETGSTWGLVNHTAAQAAQVQKDLFAMIQAAQAKYSSLLTQVSAATTVTAVEAVVWE